ncbi:MAG: dihydroorotase [Defluviitaleaceae bacterium]|nr:dihydroorotase [Defluviitaleaceae bacterium]
MITIKNGRILDPANNIDEILDLTIENGVITQIGKNLPEGLRTGEKSQAINAENMWVVPGLIDMHVHLRDPGYKHKETIKTGTQAAAKGGFTTICAMANTNPVTDNEIVVEYITSKARKEGVVHVLPIGSVTKGMAGQELSAIGEMAAAGICAISEDGKFVENPALLKTAMTYAKMFNLPILSHCEEPRITGSGQIAAGNHAENLGLKGIIPESEEMAVARDIILAKAAKSRLHICHVSTQESLYHIRNAKAKGIAVTAEVTPHHFTLCVEDIPPYDANFKMSPPLRTAADIAALKAALQDGTIDVIATDHAPHHADDKNCEFELAQNGIIGLETAISLSITELIEPKILTPLEWVAKLTVNPAKILGLADKGSLTIGTNADVTIIDPNVEYTIDKNNFASLSKNTPFVGRKTKGKALYTIVAGKIILNAGELIC